ncbi:PAS domain-containing protein [Maridesulfovibrio sp.]|uniref:helix-turn-helix transcriptional regulator n=1 Tax=Maridesulfovibrio sp. TaxID=2795000 RepID=UPI0029CA308A|nr:PAS domain-containing protein [Maridesulfovibrio sp.]
MPSTASSKSKSRKIDNYVPFVEFLGTFLGENCEVVLHDTTSKEKSVLAIANEHISGRGVGAPLTDLALKFLVNEVYREKDWMMGYTTEGRNGHILHSATYFIKDSDGELLGMLCLNMDTSDMLAARDLINKVIRSAGFERASNKEDFGGAPAEEEHSETFPKSMEDLTESLIVRVISDTNILPERMTPEEKMDVVSTLNERGVFMLKGAIKDVAKHLVVSEATVYRYLQKINDK